MHLKFEHLKHRDYVPILGAIYKDRICKVFKLNNPLLILQAKKNRFEAPEEDTVKIDILEEDSNELRKLNSVTMQNQMQR